LAVPLLLHSKVGNNLTNLKSVEQAIQRLKIIHGKILVSLAMLLQAYQWKRSIDRGSEKEKQFRTIYWQLTENPANMKRY